VSDSKLEIQMLHDRVMVRLVGEDGERRSSGGILIPATAHMAKRLSWGEVYGIGNHVRTVGVGGPGAVQP
jgi:chaperonin GroES